jgi:ectoine hydroxylase-related dioxygenase (phytanoyl-CoA dioxygenase family)
MSHAVVPGPVQPADNLDRAKEDLAQYGYCILPNALSNAQVLALRQRVEEQMEAERQRGIGYAYGAAEAKNGTDNSSKTHNEQGLASNRWVSMLINKGQVFVDLLEHPVVDELMEGFLGDGYLLSSYAVHITSPCVPATPLCHTDHWLAPRAYPRNTPHRPVGNVRRGEIYVDQGEPGKLISPPLVGNVLWFLTESNEENGGTRMLPGSHLSGEQPEADALSSTETITVTGPAGTAVVFDGRIWHGAATNRSKNLRFGLFTTYCAGMLRQLENYTLGTSPDVLAKASPHVLARLGFKPWQGYGRVGYNASDFASVERDYIGELRP